MLTLLKLGGELLEDASAIAVAADGIRSLVAAGPVVVVHGGGRAIDADLRARGAAPRFVDGVRITDAAALDSVVSVLAGRINTALVAALGAAGVEAVGLTGADARLAVCRIADPIRTAAGEDVAPGLVGIPCNDNAPRLLRDLLEIGYVPVIATLGTSPDGTLLNVNADVLAAHLARAIGAERLIIAGSTPGVYDATGSTCAWLHARAVRDMVAGGAARDGMVVKLNAALAAVDGGVRLVRIVDGRDAKYADGRGTTIVAAQEAATIRC
ncbi:MAG TPA: acetylglutamate kinase [Vicinamibacterales bacterium]|jgi:acetylglutamate kinase|nr:acetylglutamate kinase [Vicinamibacterales bacterium]